MGQSTPDKRITSADTRRRLHFMSFVNGLSRNMPLARRSGGIANHVFMKHLPDTSHAQSILQSGLERKKDFLLLRFGLYECQLCVQYLEKRNGMRQRYSDFLLYHLPMDTGLYGSDEKCYDRYAERIISALKQVDVFAYWRDYPSPLLFSKFYQGSVHHINVQDLYPFPFWHAEVLPQWQSFLSNKRVLVVSSFAKTIQRQYLKREALWKDPSILPQFELVTYQAVQTNGGLAGTASGSWESSLRHMVEEIGTLDFDIALISCGGYGMPLALAIHDMGIPAIQWGGCFQLWFGILGGRWCRDEKIAAYRTSAWVYPSAEETPPMSHLVDHSAYWKL